MPPKENLAFIDEQNLHLGTTTHETPWRVDLARFRIYLQQKYHVSHAYYFIGFVNEEYRSLYTKIQEAGFILIFREHNSAMFGKKKGNVDCDIVFLIMKKMYKQEMIGGVVLVSGDGDYKMVVDFLVEEGKLEKILFPNQKRASSLYKKIDLKYRSDLSEEGVKNKIHKKKRAP